MKKLLLACLLFSFVVSSSVDGYALPDSTELLTIEDATTMKTAADTNYGVQNTASYTYNVRTPYFKFDLASIREHLNHYEIEKAELEMFVLGQSVSGGNSVATVNDLCLNVNSVSNDDWSEDIITWNSKPEVGDVISKSETTISAGTVNTCFSWEITDAIQSELNSNPDDHVFSCSLTAVPIEGKVANQTLLFATKEHTVASYRPRLSITYKYIEYKEAIKDIHYVQNENPITVLSDAGDVTVHMDFQNWRNATSATVVNGLYKKNQNGKSELIKSYLNQEVNFSEPLSVTIEAVPDNSNNDYYIKTFVFDSDYKIYSKDILFDLNGKSEMEIPYSGYETGGEFSQNTNAEVDRDSGIITVKGNIINGTDKDLTLMVIDSNKTLRDFSENDIYYVDRAPTQAGVFTYEFLIPNTVKRRTFDAYILSRETADYSQVTFDYYLNQTIYEAIEAVNEAKTAAELNTVLETYISFLDLDLTDYNLPYVDKDRVCNFILEKAPFDTATDIKKYFDLSVGTQMLNHNSEDKTILKEIIQKYHESFDIPLNAYDLFMGTGFANDWEDEFFARMKGEVFTESNIPTKFEENLILSGFSIQSSYNEIKQLMETDFYYYFKSMLDADTYYAKIKNKNNIYKAMTDYALSDIEKIKNAFSLSCKEAYTNEKTITNSSGGSGGGGGGFSVKPSISPVIKPVENPQDTVVVLYDDLQGFDWAVDSIESLTKTNIITGYDGKFRPEDNITRAEFVKMIVSLLGLNTENAVSDFSDVDIHEWYYQYVSAACENNIVKGISDFDFGPNQNITRQDSFVMVYRVLQQKKPLMTEQLEKPEFLDFLDISDYAKEEISTLYCNDILKGSDDKIYPKNPLTRAEAAKLVDTVYQLLY